MHEMWSFFIALLALPYLLVPIFIRRNQHFALQPRLRTVLGGFLPKSIESYFDETTNALAKLGFEPRIDAVSLDFGPNLRVFMRLFVETKQSFVAICSALLPDGNNEPLRNFVELTSRFDDGHEISTHNSDFMGAPIEHRKKFTTILPNTPEIEILFAMHTRVVKTRGFGETPGIIPSQGDELNYLIHSFRNDLSKQASLGCLELDENTNCYRPTWAGAFLMGWYSMWPIGPILRLWQRWRASMKIKALLRASV